MNKLSLYVAILATTLLSGCTIGKSESDCKGKQEGTLCKGPREIYQLTNDNDDLSDLFVEASTKETKTAAPVVKAEPTQKKSFLKESAADTSKTRYIPRAADGQPAVVVNPSLTATEKQQYIHSRYRIQEQQLAPEPLAMLEQGKVLRITFAPYTDSNDALNLPGFAYINIKPQTWIAGDSATKNPSRVVPLPVQEAASNNLKEKQKSTNNNKTVSPIGVQFK